MSVYVNQCHFVVPEQKRKDAIAASNNLTQALVDHLNVGYVFLFLPTST